MKLLFNVFLLWKFGPVLLRKVGLMPSKLIETDQYGRPWADTAHPQGLPAPAAALEDVSTSELVVAAGTCLFALQELL